MREVIIGVSRSARPSSKSFLSCALLTLLAARAILMPKFGTWRADIRPFRRARIPMKSHLSMTILSATLPLTQETSSPR